MPRCLLLTQNGHRPGPFISCKFTTPGRELILADDRFAKMAKIIPYEKREASMRYKPKSVAALHIALGGLPDNMPVKADPNVGVSAKNCATD